MSQAKQLTVQASAKKTAGTINFDGFNRGKGIKIMLSVTAASGTTPTLDVKLQGRDKVNGIFLDVPGALFVQQTGAATLDLVVAPGVTAVANRAVNTGVPGGYRIVHTVGGTFVGAEGVTYSISVIELP